MSAVPYTFATDTGNIALSQLDVNFANVKARADTAVVVTASAQPNIASVGTLNSLSVTGNIATAGYFIGNGSALTGVIVSGANAAQLIGNTLSSNVVNSSLTTVGTLNGLNVAGTISTNGTVIGAYIVGGGAQLTNLTGANVSGTVANATYATSAGSATTATSATNATNATRATYANIANSVAGANVSGTVASATYAGTAGSATSADYSFTAAYVTSGAQGNITGVGTLTSLSVAGNITTGNITVPGTAGYITSTRFAGDGSNIATFENLTSQIQLLPNGNIILAPQSVVVGRFNLSQVTFEKNTVVNGNITANGTFANGTGNIVGGNVLLSGQVSSTGNVTGSYIVGNGLLLTNLTGANVSGTVANATYATSAGTVTTNAQANITSVGTLTSLIVTGNATSGNLLTAGSVSASGNIAGGNIRTAGALSATGNIIAAGLYVGSNTVMLSNVARYTWVSNIAPSAGQGNIGDIWYQTV